MNLEEHTERQKKEDKADTQGKSKRKKEAANKDLTTEEMETKHIFAKCVK